MNASKALGNQIVGGFCFIGHLKMMFVQRRQGICLPQHELGMISVFVIANRSTIGKRTYFPG